MILKVSDSFIITGRGTAVVFEDDPSDLPSEFGTKFEIEVTYKNQTTKRFSVHKEYARKTPPGEVVCILAPNSTTTDFPQGATLRVLRVLCG